MSGRVIQAFSMKPTEKHTHAVFKFEPDAYLHYVDPRRFGCLLWVPKNQRHPLLDNLGPDPLGGKITVSQMKIAAAKCSKAPIKNFLMDARRIAGVGNIYACETLFAARVHPKNPAHKIWNDSKNFELGKWNYESGECEENPWSGAEVQL